MLTARIAASGGAHLGGVHILAHPGPVLTSWLDGFRRHLLPENPWIRLPVRPSTEALLGSVDVMDAFQSGVIRHVEGVLERASGGWLIMPMAESLETRNASIISQFMDEGDQSGSEAIESDVFTGPGLIAIDESSDEGESIPGGLADRLGLRLDLRDVLYSSIEPDWPALPGIPEKVWRSVQIGDDAMEQLVVYAALSGHPSMRKLIHLSHGARILAALQGDDVVTEDVIRLTAQLFLGGVPEWPNAPEEEEASSEAQTSKGENQHPPSPVDASHPSENIQSDASATPEEKNVDPSQDKASTAPPIDAHLLASNTRSKRGRASGKSKAGVTAGRRGQIYVSRSVPQLPDQKPDIMATLRAYAPWHHLRTRSSEHAGRLAIRSEDFRYQWRRQRVEQSVIFVVDASGSTALERYGETKSAIEQLLAECYIQRCNVSLIGCKGLQAECLLPPTRSLTSAKRKLGGYPGGGATPLASGLLAGLAAARSAERTGLMPHLVILTDGRSNIDLEGAANRKSAQDDVTKVARHIAFTGVSTICFDVSRRPGKRVRELSAQLGADYRSLPHVNAASISTVVSQRLQGGAR